MTANNNDLLRKKKSMFISALTASITPDDVVIPCEFLTGIAQDTAVTLTLDRVDQNGDRTTNKVERVTGVVSGDNLINCLRGQDNTTAKSHAAGCVIEDIWDSSTWNNTVDWGLVQHNQDGTHKGNILNFIPTGAYDNATSYLINSIVSYNGASYISKSATTGNLPTDTDFWYLISAAGNDGTIWYTGAVVPDDGNGVDGDFYFRSDTHDIYRKVTGVWSLIANTTGPQGTQGVQGDPGVSVIDSDSLIATTYLSDTTNTDTYAASFAVSPGSYTAGLKVNLKVTNANTGPATLNVNSLGSKSIKKNVLDDLEADDIKAGQIIPLAYDGTNFQIVGGGGGTAGGADVLSVQVFS